MPVLPHKILPPTATGLTTAADSCVLSLTVAAVPAIALAVELRGWWCLSCSSRSRRSASFRACDLPALPGTSLWNGKQRIRRHATQEGKIYYSNISLPFLMRKAFHVGHHLRIWYKFIPSSKTVTHFEMFCGVLKTLFNIVEERLKVLNFDVSAV